MEHQQAVAAPLEDRIVVRMRAPSARLHLSITSGRYSCLTASLYASGRPTEATALVFVAVAPDQTYLAGETLWMGGTTAFDLSLKDLNAVRDFYRRHGLRISDEVAAA